MAKKPWRCWFGFHAYVRDVATDEKWLGPTAQIWRLWTGSPSARSTRAERGATSGFDGR